MPTPTRRRNLRGHGALLRDEILAAAARVIDGAASEAEVSLRRIAREAGIAAPSVYAHFADLERVLEAVTESSWVQVSDEIAENVQRAVDPRERLLIGCRVYVSFAQRHPLRYALMTQDGQTPPAARRALEAVTRGLLACRGQVPDSESDPASDRIAATLAVALHGVAMLHRSDAPNLWLSDFTTDEVIRTLVDGATLLLADPERV
ncbi:TetR/AcrR family transcriptional regulator [[Mycobacterium] kokjensenii]|uniref:TetR/AcrR family transcriptional regulator n=1 Tax=[Mycobacterium] kokjensenii TaxID=3064287 RepID=A0ABM9LWT5_9MYCO|nr:TetR/AcrR family transcriptional regulator [Mycolicibacter sp. MU0083]CAJ1506005.1 TetR/AcrR family transcriptional regulator [Mycolicibacter sp. MU0083]